MTFEPRIGDGPDEEVTRVLRSLYAAPGSDGYWLMLERRIMAGIARSEEEGWWRELARWGRTGALAASVAVAVAAATLWRAHERSQQLAFTQLFESSRSADVQLATQAGPESDRETTLRFVISP